MSRSACDINEWRLLHLRVIIHFDNTHRTFAARTWCLPDILGWFWWHCFLGNLWPRLQQPQTFKRVLRNAPELNVEPPNWSSLATSPVLLPSDIDSIPPLLYGHNPKNRCQQDSCTNLLRFRSGIGIFLFVSLEGVWQKRPWMRSFGYVAMNKEHTFQTSLSSGFSGDILLWKWTASFIIDCHASSWLQFCPLVVQEGIQRIGSQPQILASSKHNILRRVWKKTTNLSVTVKGHRDKSKPTCRSPAFCDILDCNLSKHMKLAKWGYA